MQAEAVKLMSFARADTAARIQTDLPDVKITVRLYEGGFGPGGQHPSPAQFAKQVKPHIIRLQPFANRFEVHNEPNHLRGIEGWGEEDRHARQFNEWFLEVYDRLKGAFPDLEFGFPGLAVPHRDLEWLKVCQPAIERADWFGVHCYWQNPSPTDTNHLSDVWGLRFRHYLDCGKPIEITEYGNSNTHSGFSVDWECIGQEYVAWHERVFQYPVITATHGFILSAPQREWDGFTWVGQTARPVVHVLGEMERPPLFIEPVSPIEPPQPDKKHGPPYGEDVILSSRISLWVLAAEGYLINLGAYSAISRLSSGAVRMVSRTPMCDPDMEVPDGVVFMDGGRVTCISGPSADAVWRRGLALALVDIE
jgi:hypothetical protein